MSPLESCHYHPEAIRFQHRTHYHLSPLGHVKRTRVNDHSDSTNTTKHTQINRYNNRSEQNAVKTRPDAIGEATVKPRGNAYNH